MGGGGDKNFRMNTAACGETETFTKNSTHHALSEALRREHILTVIPTLHTHRGSSVWEHRRRNNPSSPANCVYPGWRRRAPRWAGLSPSSGPLLPPAPVDLDIVGYFKPQFTSLMVCPETCTFCVCISRVDVAVFVRR